MAEVTTIAGAARESTAPKTHNVDELKKIRRECAAGMREIIEQRKDLNEQAGDIRERLRDNGIDVKSFMAGLRLVDMEDVAARDNYIDGLRLTFEALGQGEMADMVDELQKQQEADG
jgi:hypothetical protein